MARTPSESRQPPVRSGTVGTVLATAAIAVVGILAVVAVGSFWPRGERVRNGPPIEVSGWAPYWQPNSALASFTANATLFGEVSLVAYSARGADEIVPYDGVADGVLDTYRRAADSNGAPLVATVFDDTDRGEMAAVLADPASRARHVDALVELVDAGGFDGLELDYEGFAFVDDRSTWATTRPAWIALLTDLAARLRPTGALLMVAVPPQFDDERTNASGYWVYDFAAMGQVVDRIRIMAYDYSLAEPGPVAPIDWVERVVEAAALLVDPAKLDLGIPTYGYEWVVARSGTCPAGDDRERRPISIARMGRELASRGLVPTWDEATAEVTFEYSETLTGDDGNGTSVTCTVTRVVYAPDARSIHRRALLAFEHDFHGVALWALGNDDEATWDALGAAQRGESTWPADSVDAAPTAG